jgi:hypothetical protein
MLWLLFDRRGELFQQGADAATQIVVLLMKQAQSRQQGVLGGSVVGSGRQAEGLAFQRGQHPAGE